MVKNVQVIAKTRVPIAKFTEVESGISFDVSFDKENGPQAAAFIKGVMKQFVPMRSLMIVLKLFLQQRELNEVYTGGIGSYALITMLIVELLTYNLRNPSTRSIKPGSKQDLHCTGSKRIEDIGEGQNGRHEADDRTKKKRKKSRDGIDSEGQILEGCLGQLLLDFFRFYGIELNQKEVGISTSSGGTFYHKETEGLLLHNRPFLLSCRDPQDDGNDLCRNSYNWPQIRQAFAYAYQLLIAMATKVYFFNSSYFHLMSH